MKDYELLEAVGGVDTRFIEAAAAPGKKKSGRWKGVIAAAACFAVIIGAYLAYPKKPAPPAPNPNGMIERPGEPGTTPENPVILRPGDEGYIDPMPTPEPGLYIPAIELPENTGDYDADMIGFVIYRGGIYTQAETYRDDDARRVEPLLGEYLGYATGSIDEWSRPEAYEEEFAGSIAGDLYAVRGYDTDFRLCVRWESESENGEKTLLIEFLERLNDITLSTGADLFESRLRLRGCVETVEWQAHEDWDWNKGNIRAAELPDGAWDAFLDALCAGEFVSTWRGTEAFYDEPYSSIYDTKAQAHLILSMEDGTTVRLRLIEGGYVGYDALGWYFVQMPGEAFDAVYDACTP